MRARGAEAAAGPRRSRARRAGVRAASSTGRDSSPSPARVPTARAPASASRTRVPTVAATAARAERERSRSRFPPGWTTARGCVSRERETRAGGEDAPATSTSSCRWRRTSSSGATASTSILTWAVPFHLAALGGTLRVPTLHGDASFDVPPGTAAGRVFTLKGQGHSAPRRTRQGRPARPPHGARAEEDERRAERRRSQKLADAFGSESGTPTKDEKGFFEQAEGFRGRVGGVRRGKRDLQCFPGCPRFMTQAIRIEIPAVIAASFEENGGDFLEGLGGLPFASTVAADGRLLVWVEPARPGGCACRVRRARRSRPFHLRRRTRRLGGRVGRPSESRPRGRVISSTPTRPISPRCRRRAFAGSSFRRSGPSEPARTSPRGSPCVCSSRRTCAAHGSSTRAAASGLSRSSRRSKARAMSWLSTSTTRPPSRRASRRARTESPRVFAFAGLLEALRERLGSTSSSRT